MSSLVLPAISSFNTQLQWGGPTSPPSYVLVGRLGDIKFNGVAIDMVDVSNQTSTAHRMLGTLLKTGALTANHYWEPDDSQDQSLFDIIITAPPALQQWEVIWPDGTIWAFNAYLSKWTPDASIGKALVAALELTIDDSISVTYP